MNRIAWGDLQRFGIGHMRLSPKDFWALTPRELMILAGISEFGAGHLDKSGLDALMRAYPDAKVGGNDGGT